MYLHEWMCEQQKKDHRFTLTKFARKVGVTAPYLSTIRHWVNRPKYEILKKIEELTGGQVKAIDTLEKFVVEQASENPDDRKSYINRKKGKKPKEK